MIDDIDVIYEMLKRFEVSIKIVLATLLFVILDGMYEM